MRSFLRPLPRAVTRPVSILIADRLGRRHGGPGQPLVPAGRPRSLATDLARYGSAAVWRGVYYRGEKIGFTVSQTVPTGRRVRARRGRPAADVAARRDDRRDDPHDRARGRGVRAALVRVLARSRHRPDRGARPASTAGASRSTSRRRAARAREVRELDGAAGAVAEPVAPAGERRPGARRAASVDRVRSGDAAQRAGRTSRSASARWCAAPAPRRCRRSASRWSSPACRPRRG